MDLFHSVNSEWGKRGKHEKSAAERICNYVRPHFSMLLPHVIVCRVLLLQLTVTVHEAVNATSCVNQLALASIERVGGA